MIILYTVTAIFAFFFQVFFTATEMALTTVDKIKLKSLVTSGNIKARELEIFLRGKDMFLGTTLVGTNISVIVSTAMVTRLFSEYVPSRLAAFCTTLTMVPLILLFAEIIPKMIARQHSLNMALNLVSPLKALNNLFKPVVFSFNAISQTVLFPFIGRVEVKDMTITKKDLKDILRSGHEEGEVEKSEVDIIHKVLDFGAKVVSEKMIPLYKVYSIGENDTIDDLKKIVSLTGFSRFPVFCDTKSNIIGTVNIYEVFFSGKNNVTGSTIKEFLREPVTLRSHDGLDIALTRLRNRKQPMGIVINDNGKAVGLITIEDILEDLVGSIEDKSV